MSNKEADIEFYRTRIGIKLKNGYKFYYYYEIVEVFSDARYSVINTSDSKSYYVSTPIKLFEKRFPYIFFKYKRSGLVNLAYMVSYSNENKKTIIYLKNNNSHLISRYLRNNFYSRIQNLDISLPCEICKTCIKRTYCPDVAPFIT